MLFMELFCVPSLMDTQGLEGHDEASETPQLFFFNMVGTRGLGAQS